MRPLALILLLGSIVLVGCDSGARNCGRHLAQVDLPRLDGIRLSDAPDAIVVNVFPTPPDGLSPTVDPTPVGSTWRVDVDAFSWNPPPVAEEIGTLASASRPSTSRALLIRADRRTPYGTIENVLRVFAALHIQHFLLGALGDSRLPCQGIPCEFGTVGARGPNLEYLPVIVAWNHDAARAEMIVGDATVTITEASALDSAGQALRRLRERAPHRRISLRPGAEVSWDIAAKVVAAAHLSGWSKIHLALLPERESEEIDEAALDEALRGVKLRPFR
jgi:biopolymer transport protein ExbD